MSEEEEGLTPDQQAEEEAVGTEADQETEQTEETEPQAEDEESTEDSSEPTYTPAELSAAQRFGVPEDELTPGLAEKLAKAQSDIGRRYSQLGRKEQEARTAPAKPPEPAFEKFEHKFDPEVYGDDVDIFTKMMNRINEMSEQMTGFQKTSETAQLAESERVADSFFERLDSKTYPEFGEGRGAELDHGGPAMEARNRVWEKANQLSLGCELASGTPMDFEDALQQALCIEAPNAKVETARRDARNSRKRGVTRPNKSRTSRTQLSADEKFDAALDKFNAERGGNILLSDDA